MKNKYWFLYPWILLLAIAAIALVLAWIDGNIWLFSECFKLESHTAWDIARAILVGVADLVAIGGLVAFLFENSDGSYDIDDD